MSEEKFMAYVGHRGSRGVGVENTIEAFLEGINRGYVALECDIRVTKDNEFVVFHDDNLDRLGFNIPSNKRLITDYAYGGLKEVTLKQMVDEQVLTGTIPLLKDFLRLCKKHQVKAIIEIKWSKGLNNNDLSNLSQLMDLIKQEGMYEDSTILTSMKNVLATIREQDKQIPLQLLIGANTPINEENIQFALDHRLSIDVEKTIVHKEVIEVMHKNNLLVNVWTVNDPSLADELIKLGVDLITTDVLC